MQEVEEPQPALAMSPASEKGMTPTKAMYLKTKQGQQGVLQVHQAGWLSWSEVCSY